MCDLWSVDDQCLKHRQTGRSISEDTAGKRRFCINTDYQAVVHAFEFNAQPTKTLIDFVQIFTASVRIEWFAGEGIHEIGPVAVLPKTCAHLSRSYHEL